MIISTYRKKIKIIKDYNKNKYNNNNNNSNNNNFLKIKKRMNKKHN